MATLILDIGRTSPWFGFNRDRMPDGTSAITQFNLGLFAIAWMPLSLTALMDTWMRQVRKEAWAAFADMQPATEEEIEALLREEGDHGTED